MAPDDDADLEALFDQTARPPTPEQQARWARHAAALPDRPRRRWWWWAPVVPAAAAITTFALWPEDPRPLAQGLDLSPSGMPAAIGPVPADELGDLELLIAAADDTASHDDGSEADADTKASPRIRLPAGDDAAQEQPPKSRVRKNAKQRRARLAAVKRRVLEKRVGLTREEATEVLKLFVDHDEERRELRRRLRKANQSLKRLIADDENDEAAYASALEEIKQVRAAILASREKQLSALESMLPPRKRARLLAVMHKVRRRMNQKR